MSVDNWDTIDTRFGGKQVGGLPKSQALKAWGATKGITIMDLAEGTSSIPAEALDTDRAVVEAIGSQNLTDFIPPSPDALHSIMYTSGTTGNVSAHGK